MHRGALTMELKTKKEKTQVIVPVRLQKTKLQKIDKAVKKLGYRSRSEFIRKAVKHYLENVLTQKIIELREVSVEEAVKLIDNYLTNNPGVHYVSEIAEQLGIDIETAFKAVEKMLKEETIEVA